MTLQNPSPILVADRFPALLDALLGLLSQLSPEDWNRPTIAAGWSVKDVALHLLGDDIGFLSWKRDSFSELAEPIEAWDDLVTWINQRNAQWVQGTRRMSPQMLCTLLRFTGDQVNGFFRSMDVYALGAPVDWAGPQSAPVWLDIAREFTERWHHQQHIRDAVGMPGDTDPGLLAPVLATFVYALPQTYQSTDAPEKTCITLTITGAAGGSWSVVREHGTWQLYAGAPDQPQAEVVLPEQVAWRLFTKGLGNNEARSSAELRGDMELAQQMLRTISIHA
ncbi:MAG: maleylpyruvate isomerase family mycothiol-dependent enzyme [Anaerolineaceae bacterium]|nr:maleylpyruvate isomerase family mycothiol-dependent enzyme [Anaerolineaceae bacterium]